MGATVSEEGDDWALRLFGGGAWRSCTYIMVHALQEIGMQAEWAQESISAGTFLMTTRGQDRTDVRLNHRVGVRPTIVLFEGGKSDAN